MGAGVKTDLGCNVPMSEVSCGESISAWLEAWRAAGANAADAERVEDAVLQEVGGGGRVDQTPEVERPGEGEESE